MSDTAARPTCSQVTAHSFAVWRTLNHNGPLCADCAAGFRTAGVVLVVGVAIVFAQLFADFVPAAELLPPLRL